MGAIGDIQHSSTAVGFSPVRISLVASAFITVLHHLFTSGSDRAAEQWCQRYAVGNLGGLHLRHFYRTMGWLGEPLPADEQPAETPQGQRLR